MGGFESRKRLSTMSSKMNQKAKVRGPRQNLRKQKLSARRSPAVDNALMLRPEYNGQPVVEHMIESYQGPLSTTVTTGQIALLTAMSGSSIISSLPTRFAGYSEYRISKVRAKVRTFGSTLPGIITQWFSEDDSSTPTATKATQAMSRSFSASSNEKEHTVTYVPHDPAQQTWTLVASGAPVVGYHKLYTDNANFGSSIVATPYLSVMYDVWVQFRGFV
jgi:hypothetical protein